MKAILALLILGPIQAGMATEHIDRPVIKDSPLVERIAEINPKLDLAYRRLVVRELFKAANKYKVSADSLFAIFAQESKFRVNTVNTRTHDYGIGQVNIRNIRYYNWDQKRLLSDVAYSVDCAAFMLSGFKRFAKREPSHWWTRYNSSNPEKRQEYGILVARYM